MDDVYVYLIDMPDNIHEFVTPCTDGYTLYINRNLSERKRFEAYRHAVKHIQSGDFEKNCNVDTVEVMAHQH